MRPGTYRDVNGVLVTVRRTSTGFSVSYPDGTVTMIGAGS